MGIIAPNTGIFAVQSFPNEPGLASYSIDLGAGVYRISSYLKCYNTGAGTRVVHAYVDYAYNPGGGAGADLAGGDLSCSAETNSRTDHFTVMHDGSVPLIVGVTQTVAGALDTYDAIFVIEKVWEDFQS